MTSDRRPSLYGPPLNQFAGSAPVHSHTQLDICNEIINKDPTSPQMCCYTTLRNINVCKSSDVLPVVDGSVGVSKLGCTHLISVDPDVNINGCYYCEVLLSQQLLPVTWCLATSSCYKLQQDSAPAHTARDARQSTCCYETPAFISPDL